MSLCNLPGIIIDTFAELRQRNLFVTNDTLNRCFICHQSREIFERHELDMDKHTREDHNMYVIAFPAPFAWP